MSNGRETSVTQLSDRTKLLVGGFPLLPGGDCDFDVDYLLQYRTKASPIADKWMTLTDQCLSAGIFSGWQQTYKIPETDGLIDNIRFIARIEGDDRDFVMEKPIIVRTKSGSSPLAAQSSQSQFPPSSVSQIGSIGVSMNPNPNVMNVNVMNHTQSISSPPSLNSNPTPIAMTDSSNVMNVMVPNHNVSVDNHNICKNNNDIVVLASQFTQPSQRDMQDDDEPQSELSSADQNTQMTQSELTQSENTQEIAEASQVSIGKSPSKKRKRMAKSDETKRKEKKKRDQERAEKRQTEERAIIPSASLEY